MLVPLSEPPVLGAHLLLQWPFVCSRGEEAGVGLRPHCHTSACYDHQPWWAEMYCNNVSTQITHTLLHMLRNWTLCFRIVAVMLEFPMVWQWWLALGKNKHDQLFICVLFYLTLCAHLSLTLHLFYCSSGSGLFLMICNGQLIAYFTCQSEQSYASFSIYWHTEK